MTGRPTETPCAPTGGFVAEVERACAAWRALAAEWDELYGASRRATPFQAHGWLNSWWGAYGRPGRLHLVLVRDGAGRLVAAAPLYRRVRWGVRVLTPLGGAISDFHDVLVAEDHLEPGQVPAVISAMADCLRSSRDWDVLDLPEVRPGAAGELLHRSWPGPRWQTESSTCMELRDPTFDDLLERLSGKRAGEVRRRLRRADELGLVATDVAPDDVEEAVAALIRLHTQQWTGRGINPEHLRPRFAQHIGGALATMVRERQAGLTRIQLDGREVAVTVDLVGHSMVCGYLMGVAPELYRKTDVTAYVLREAMQRTSAAGLSTFSMLRGRESYKQRWRPVVADNRRLLMGRPGSLLSRPFAWAVLVRTRAADVVRDRLGPDGTARQLGRGGQRPAPAGRPGRDVGRTGDRVGR